MDIIIPEPDFDRKQVIERKAEDLFRGYLQSMMLDTSKGLELIRDLLYDHQEHDQVIILAHLINRVTTQRENEKGKLKPNQQFGFEREYQDILFFLYNELDKIGISFSPLTTEELEKYIHILDAVSLELEAIAKEDPSLNEKASLFKEKFNALKKLVGLDKESLFDKTKSVILEILLTKGFESIGKFLINNSSRFIEIGAKLLSN